MNWSGQVTYQALEGSLAQNDKNDNENNENLKYQDQES